MADKSDGGTVALQQLDVVLAENTKPVISEAEKTRHFMEVLYGEPIAKKILQKDDSSAGEAGLTADTMQKSEPDGPLETEKVGPGTKLAKNPERKVLVSSPQPSPPPGGEEETLVASGHEPAAGTTHPSASGGAQGTARPTEPSESKQVEIKSENPPRRVRRDRRTARNLQSCDAGRLKVTRRLTGPGISEEIRYDPARTVCSIRFNQGADSCKLSPCLILLPLLDVRTSASPRFSIASPAGASLSSMTSRG